MIIYRSEKGSPLSIEEMDGNFRDLDDRIQAFENQKELGDSIVDVQVSGNQMTFVTVRGQKIGPVELPVITYTPRGEWAQNTDYTIYDVVSYKGGAYVCTALHTSQDFEKEHTFWKVLLKPEVSRQPTQAPHLTQLQLFEPKTLPKAPELGQLGLFLDGKGLPILIVGDGSSWRQVTTYEKVKGEET